MNMKLVDMHCDTMYRIADFKINHNIDKELYENDGHIDIKKLQQGGCLTQFFAIYIPTYEKPVVKSVAEDAYDLYKYTLDVYNREMDKNPDTIRRAFNYNDIMKNKADGKMSSILTIEDSVPANGRLDRIKEFYDDGVRLMTLTWNYENSLGFPNSRDPELMAKSLKPFGIEAIQLMNQLGIIVDVSHLSDGGFWDVVKYTDKPFVASHSCCRALCPHPRDLTDEMLKALGERGGAVGINFSASFLNEDATYTDIASVIRHMLHIKDKAGIDALAFGSDFDGIESTLEFENYAGMPRIIDAMTAHFTDDEIDKICSGNVLRVIRDSMK